MLTIFGVGPEWHGIKHFSDSVVVDFDELGAVIGEELIRFRSPFDGPWFAAEGADVDHSVPAVSQTLPLWLVIRTEFR